MAVVAPSSVMYLAAMEMPISPEEHWRSMVAPETLVGRPARSRAWRATLPPVEPCCKAQPRITSSTPPGSIPARFTASLITWPPSSGPVVLLKAPR